MKISIALAVYNGTNYIEEQLASYLVQTKLPDELVVVDDCSTDRTVEILKGFAKRAPFPVRILENEKNLGSTASFDRAITNCMGDLIFPSDHDDIWVPTKIERMSHEFEKSPNLGLLFVNAELIDEKSRPMNSALYSSAMMDEIENLIETGNLFGRILQENVVGGATSAFRREHQRYFTPIPRHLDLLHDGWIGLMLAATTECRFSREKFNCYRQHGSQQVGALGKKVSFEEFSRSEMYSDAIATFKKKEQDLKFILDKLQQILKLEPDNPHSRIAFTAAEMALVQLPDAIQHFSVRGKLEKNRLKRIPSILIEVFTGRYHRYSNGFRSFVRDLYYQ